MLKFADGLADTATEPTVNSEVKNEDSLVTQDNVKARNQVNAKSKDFNTKYNNKTTKEGFKTIR